MILNDATFIVQWLVLFGIKEDFGGYTFNNVLVLWALAATTFGFSRLFFYKAFELPDLIINGKLDSFLVQPKNVLISVITSDTSISAIGDILYGFIVVLFMVMMDLVRLKLMNILNVYQMEMRKMNFINIFLQMRK